MNDVEVKQPIQEAAAAFSSAIKLMTQLQQVTEQLKALGFDIQYSVGNGTFWEKIPVESWPAKA